MSFLILSQTIYNYINTLAYCYTNVRVKMNKIYYKINTSKILHFDMRAQEKKLKQNIEDVTREISVSHFFCSKKYEVKKRTGKHVFSDMTYISGFDNFFYIHRCIFTNQRQTVKHVTKKLFVRVCDGVREIDNRKVQRFFI